MSRTVFLALMMSLLQPGITKSAGPDVPALIANRLQSTLIAARDSPETLPDRLRIYCVLQNRATTSEMLVGEMKLTTLQDQRRDEIAKALLKVSRNPEELSVWKTQQLGGPEDRIYWVWIDVTPRLLNKAVDTIVKEVSKVEVIDVSEKTIGTTKVHKIAGDSPEPVGRSFRSIVARQGGLNTARKIGRVIFDAHKNDELDVVTLTNSEAVVSCTPDQLKKLSASLAKIEGADIRRVPITWETRNPLHLQETTISDARAKSIRETLQNLVDSGYEFPVTIIQQNRGMVIRARISERLVRELRKKGFKVN